MLLKDRLVKTGHFFFRYRGWQPWPILLILIAEKEQFNQIDESLGYEMFCILVSLCGLAIRGLTVGFVHDGTSGRNTTEQRASELNTTGAYSLVRNPLYLGNYLVLMGVSLLTQSPGIVLLNTAIFTAVHLPIILTEEAFLLDKFGESYAAYAKRVNCMVPSFKSYSKNVRKFSYRMLLKREHDTLLTTILSLMIIEVLREYGQWGALRLEPLWVAFAGTVAATWVVLKYLKKTGRLVFRQDEPHRQGT